MLFVVSQKRMTTLEVVAAALRSAGYTIIVHGPKHIEAIAADQPSVPIANSCGEPVPAEKLPQAATVAVQPLAILDVAESVDRLMDFCFRKRQLLTEEQLKLLDQASVLLRSTIKTGRAARWIFEDLKAMREGRP